MIKQKRNAFFLAFIPFGLTTSFVLNFSCPIQEGILIALFVLFFLMGFSPKLNKKALQAALKLKTFGLMLFLFAFVLSFVCVSMINAFLFSSLVFNTLCLAELFEIKKEIKEKKIFCFFLILGAVLGIALSCLFPFSLGIILFSLSALLVGEDMKKASIEELWIDVALPVFVLIFSFVTFMISNHEDGFPLLIAECVVMVMIGALPMVCARSNLRLMLMAVVLMLFGSYVFSTQNPTSFFNMSAPFSLSSSFELF